MSSELIFFLSVLGALPVYAVVRACTSETTRIERWHLHLLGLLGLLFWVSMVGTLAALISGFHNWYYRDMVYYVMKDLCLASSMLLVELSLLLFFYRNNFHASFRDVTTSSSSSTDDTTLIEVPLVAADSAENLNCCQQMHRRFSQTLFFQWISAASTFMQCLGVMFTVSLFLELTFLPVAGAQCSNSSFVVYYDHIGCVVTQFGLLVLVGHLIFELGFLYCAMVHFTPIESDLLNFLSNESGGLNVIMHMLVPIGYALFGFVYRLLAHLLWQLSILIRPIWLRRQQNWFRSWNGEQQIQDDIEPRPELVSSRWGSRKELQNIQTANLFLENVMEVFISASLFMGGYTSTASMLFSVPPTINTLYRVTNKLVEWTVCCCRHTATEAVSYGNECMLCCDPQSGPTSSSSNPNSN
jgi:hypothetical protein